MGFKESNYYKSKEHLNNALNSLKIANEKNKEIKKNRIEKYNINPNFCLNCNISLEYNKKRNKFCSQSCSASYSNEKRKINDKTRKKIKNSLKEYHGNNPEYVEINCRKCEKIIKVKWSDRKRRKNCSNCNKNRSDDVKSKLSEIMSNKIKNGTFKPQLKSIKCFYNFKSDIIRCDSKVEYSCLDYFEKNFDVLDIKRCDFLIDYINNNGDKKYNPDFLITTKNGIYVVECKGIISNKNLQRKWSYYYDSIPYKKEALDKYCKENGFISFNYNKSMNSKFYNKCKPNLINTNL